MLPSNFSGGNREKPEAPKSAPWGRTGYRVISPAHPPCRSDFSPTPDAADTPDRQGTPHVSSTSATKNLSSELAGDRFVRHRLRWSPWSDLAGAIGHSDHEDVLRHIHISCHGIHFDFLPRRFRLSFRNSILALGCQVASPPEGWGKSFLVAQADTLSQRSSGRLSFTLGGLCCSTYQAAFCVE